LNILGKSEIIGKYENNFQYRDNFKDAFDEKELDRIFKKDFKEHNS
tara:strand:+ start:936 stop:1073 length:138 start_codon:yes stop_codon:yes gene_type:complete